MRRAFSRLWVLVIQISLQCLPCMNAVCKVFGNGGVLRRGCQPSTRLDPFSNRLGRGFPILTKQRTGILPLRVVVSPTWLRFICLVNLKRLLARLTSLLGQWLQCLANGSNVCRVLKGALWCVWAVAISGKQKWDVPEVHGLGSITVNLQLHPEVPMDSEPSTLNLQPSTLSPQPSTLNPQP